MGKLGITKKKLLKEYNLSIDRISDDLEYKVYFTGEEVCQIVTIILEENKVKTRLLINELYEIYKNKVRTLGFTDTEWVNTHGISEIIDIIYEILEDNC